MLNLSEVKIGVIGLGYVGLPLAVEFGKKFPTVGFDISAARIEELKQFKDHTLEVDSEELRSAQLLTYSCDKTELKACNLKCVRWKVPKQVMPPLRA